MKTYTRFGMIAFGLILSLATVGLAHTPSAYAVTNLIANGNFENATSHWTKDSWGNLNANFVYPADGKSGNAAEVRITNYGGSGDAKWVPDAVSVKSGDTYTYSDTYRSNTDTEIDVKYIDKNGNTTYDYLTALPASATFKKASVTFTIPEGVKKMSILHIIYSNGTLTIDDATLIQETGHSDNDRGDDSGNTEGGDHSDNHGSDNGNTEGGDHQDGNGSDITCGSTSGKTLGLIKNGNFESCKGDMPTSWTTDNWGENTAVFTYPTDGKSGHGAKITMSNYRSGDAKWVPEAVRVSAGEQYTYADTYRTNTDTEIDVKYIHQNGNVSYDYLAALPASSNWKTKEVTFTVPEGVKEMSIIHIIYSNGTLSIDNASLSKEGHGSDNNSGNEDSGNDTGGDHTGGNDNGGDNSGGNDNGDENTGGNTNPPAGNDSSCSASSGTTLGLVKNGTLEDCQGGAPAHWSHDAWGDLNATFTYPANGKSGNGAKVSITNYGSSGDAKWVPEPVSVEANATYVYTDTYKASAETEIDVMYIDNNGKETYNYLTTAPKSSSWNTVKTTLTIPSGTKKIAILHILHSNGTLTIDNTKLEKVSAGHEGGEGMVTIDFDDGWQSQYDLALPILKKADIPATFYIITNPLVKGWSGYMSASEVKNLSDMGYEIQSHTVNHPHLPTLSKSEIKEQVTQSKKYLEDLTGKSIDYLSYPYGQWNDTVINIVKEAGYKGARTTHSGTNNGATSPYKLRATSVHTGTTLSEVKGWIDEAKKTDTWMIITFHRIGEPGNEYSASPEFLQSVVDYAKSSGISIVSESEGVSRLR